MFELVEGQLAAGNSVIAETNFYPEMDRLRVEALRASADFSTIEVHCTADLDVAVARYRDRQDTAERHPGHRAEESELREQENVWRDGFFHPMGLDGESLTVDTTDFGKVDLDAVVEAVRSILDRE